MSLTRDQNQVLSPPESGDRNPTCIRCSKCKCLLLREGHGLKVQESVSNLPHYVLPEPVCAHALFVTGGQVDLPNTDAPRDSDPSQVTTETDFLLVDDIFTFENMGFSHTVESRKYLACAECEFGPIGYHDLTSGKSYLSVARVNPEDHPPTH